MVLEFKVDSLEGLEDSVKEMYVEKDGAFFLDVKGIPEPEDVGGLKSALEKERDARRANEKRVRELEDAQKQGKQKQLEEQEQYKELYEQFKADNDSLKSQINDGYKQRFKDKVVGFLTQDEKKAKLLSLEIDKNLEVIEGQVHVTGIAGVNDESSLRDYMKENYPFLVDGSKAQGGGAAGSRDGMSGKDGLLTKEEVRNLPENEKRAYFAKHGYTNYKED